MARIDTDAQNSVWIGGGRSASARIVSQEFADVTGGSKINWKKNKELTDLLQEILRGDGVDGVELVSITENSFMISFGGWKGSQNYLEFTGSAAEEAIRAVHESSGQSGALESGGSGMTMFELSPGADEEVAGPSSSSNSTLATELRLLVEEESEVGSMVFANSPTSVEPSDVELAAQLLTAATSGLAKRDTVGLDDVELVGLTQEGFTLRVTTKTDDVETFVFSGEGAKEAIAIADDGSNVDFKDKKSGFDVFDVAAETSEFVGSAGRQQIGEALADIIGSSSIRRDDVLEIFDDLTSGNGRRGDTGVEGVELVGMDDTSFSISVASSQGNTEYLLFTNVHTLQGADTFGFETDSPL